MEHAGLSFQPGELFKLMGDFFFVDGASAVVPAVVFRRRIFFLILGSLVAYGVTDFETLGGSVFMMLS